MRGPVWLMLKWIGAYLGIALLSAIFLKTGWLFSLLWPLTAANYLLWIVFPPRGSG